jgi:hypothetical protein
MSTVEPEDLSRIVPVSLSQREWLMIATILAETSRGIRDQPMRVMVKELGLNIIKQART